MELWPAIDLRGGKCVRLLQGDYDRETVFGDDPVAMVRRFVAQGAKRLHIVDLDGAKAGQPVQADLIARMVAAAMPVSPSAHSGVLSFIAAANWSKPLPPHAMWPW